MKVIPTGMLKAHAWAAIAAGVHVEVKPLHSCDDGLVWLRMVSDVGATVQLADALQSCPAAPAPTTAIHCDVLRKVMAEALT